MAARQPAARPRRDPAGVSLLENGGRNDGPPDLDELWRDFNKKLSGLFSGRGGSRRGNGGGDPGGGPNFQPNLKSAGVGAALIGGVIVLIWLGSGVFIVQEGQQAVVTSFGRYSHTVDAGFQWRFPYPFQAHETVNVTQLRSTEVGRNSVSQATGPARLVDADPGREHRRHPLHGPVPAEGRARLPVREPRSRGGGDAGRRVGGARDRRQEQDRLGALRAARRDRQRPRASRSRPSSTACKTGVLIVNVNVQSVQPPEQVQAAFEDTLKAGQDGDRLKKEGQAYASSEIPKAQGTSARLRQEAEGYKARVVAQAEGDADRFARQLVEYQKAPQVTRERLYIDTMREVYCNITKVMIDARNNTSLLQLPLDRLLQQAAAGTAPPGRRVGTCTSGDARTPTPASGTVDVRSRENQRGRDRDSR